MCLLKACPQTKTSASQTHSDNLCVVFNECLYLRALYIPGESCGRGHLALLTAGSCFWVHMGI